MTPHAVSETTVSEILCGVMCCDNRKSPNRYTNGCIVTGPAGTPCIWRSDIIILVGWCYAGVAWLDAYL